MLQTELNPYDIYQNRIYRYLKDYFPHLWENPDDVRKMIINRGNKAQKAYTNATLEGKNHIEAMEEANDVLHADLEFSPIVFIEGIYEDKTGEILSDENAIVIYKKSKSIFDKYGKDVEGSDNELTLIEELMPYLDV